MKIFSIIGTRPQYIKSNDARFNKGNIKVITAKKIFKYISFDITKGLNYSDIKIVFEKTNGGYKKTGFSNLQIITEKCLTSESIAFFPVDTLEEAKSLLSYLKSDFLFMLRDFNQTDKNFNAYLFKNIPLVPLDRVWTDLEIKKYFKLTKEEAKFIELYRGY